MSDSSGPSLLFDGVRGLQAVLSSCLHLQRLHLEVGSVFEARSLSSPSLQELSLAYVLPQTLPQKLDLSGMPALCKVQLEKGIQLYTNCQVGESPAAWLAGIREFACKLASWPLEAGESSVVTVCYEYDEESSVGVLKPTMRLSQQMVEALLPWQQVEWPKHIRRLKVFRQGFSGRHRHSLPLSREAKAMLAAIFPSAKW